MLKFLTLILGVHLSFALQGQSVKEKLYFRVICGAGGQSSKEIDSFKSISSLKDSAEIKKKLFTGSDIE